MVAFAAIFVDFVMRTRKNNEIFVFVSDSWESK